VAISRDRPNDVELRARLRAWFLYFMQEWKLNGKEMAKAVGISPPMVTSIVKHGEPPGLDSFVGMHFAFGESMSRMVREYPPHATRAATPKS
jgi:hypothetical protein